MFKTIMAAVITVASVAPARSMEMPQFDIKVECAAWPYRNSEDADCLKGMQNQIELNYLSWLHLSEESQKFCVEHAHSLTVLTVCIFDKPREH